MPSNQDTTFLTLDQILDIHDDQLRNYGGRPGIRDTGLLEAAVAMPVASFGGEFVHETLTAKAAAYLFHLTRNHPFIDGNKRTGTVAALVFLALNGVVIEADGDALAEMVEAVARGERDKEAIASWFDAHRRDEGA